MGYDEDSLASLEAHDLQRRRDPIAVRQLMARCKQTDADLRALASAITTVTSAQRAALSAEATRIADLLKASALAVGSGET